MATSEQYFNLVRTSKSSWIAVPIHQTAKSSDGTGLDRGSEDALLRNASAAPGQLLAQASATDGKLSQRFPRLTIATLAFLLFAIGVTAEVELLHHAGLLWK